MHSEMVCRRGLNHTGREASTRTAASQAAVLEADGLAAFRGERLVFRDLSFAVPAGGALLLTGPNGSGKSTLLRLLAGLVPVAAGSVRWNGDDALDDLSQHARRLVYLGHKDAVKPSLTVAENLAFAARLGGGSVATGLAAVGLTELAELPARMLSAGQQRRLAVARLAVSAAPLWLLDEPTLGLDARSVELFGALLSDHRRRGGLVVAATHLALPLPDATELRLAPDTPAREEDREKPTVAAYTVMAGEGRPSTSSRRKDVDGGDRPGHDEPGTLSACDHPLLGGGVKPTLHRFAAILTRELHLSVRHGADTMAALLFFLLVIALYPLGIGPSPEVLGRIAPGIIWVAALLAALLPLDRLFGADFEDGSLDLLLVSGLPTSGTAAAKAVAHWLVTGLPLLLAAAPLAEMLSMPAHALPALLLGLLPGTMLLSLLGTAGAAVVLGARRGGVLLPLLVLPLAVPVLVFGAAAADAAATGLTPRPHLLLLGALLAVALPLCPLAAGGALRGASE